jgi:predicted nucleotidyltransferase
MEQIKQLSQRIGTEFNPEKIVLFGSYARNEASEDSDVDLLIIVPFTGKSVHQSVKIRMKTRPQFPVDLIVRTPETVKKRLQMGDSFLKNILEKGKVLYEASHH